MQKIKLSNGIEMPQLGFGVFQVQPGIETENSVKKVFETGAVKAVDLELTTDEINYLEELYIPHPLAGVMAMNKPENAKETKSWSTGDQKIGK